MNWDQSYADFFKEIIKHFSKVLCNIPNLKSKKKKNDKKNKIVLGVKMLREGLCWIWCKSWLNL